MRPPAPSRRSSGTSHRRSLQHAAASSCVHDRHPYPAGGTLADEQASVRTMHANLKARLKELDAKEERLLYLRIDDTLPQGEIKARLRQIQSDQ